MCIVISTLLQGILCIQLKSAVLDSVDVSLLGNNVPHIMIRTNCPLFQIANGDFTIAYKNKTMTATKSRNGLVPIKSKDLNDTNVESVMQVRNVNMGLM